MDNKKKKFIAVSPFCFSNLSTLAFLPPLPPGTSFRGELRFCFVAAEIRSFMSGLQEEK